MTTKPNISVLVFFILSFIEGGCVMATELTGARVLGPIFGSGLYVWSAVLAITLSGLAFGYYLGGRMSTMPKPEKKLMYVLILAGLFMIAMPFLGKFCKIFAFKLPLLPAVSVSALIVLFPPLMFMGMVSPLIIHSLISENKGGGKRAGEVYAVSTAGGILFTFLTGFWLLPSFGIDMPMMILGGVLMFIPLIMLFNMKEPFQAIILIAFAGFLMYTNIVNRKPKPETIYESDGIIGHVEVVDFVRINPETGKKEHPRMLLVNNIVQTAIDLETDDYIMDYSGEIDSNLVEDASGKKALVIGLGGGVVANILKKKGYDVTAVELDERNYEAASKFFKLDKDIKVVIDDGRNYVNRMTEKYDVMMIDVFKGEDPPYYVLTKESITKLKSSLNPGGKILVNTYGYLQLPKGKGNLALIKTFKECGLEVRLVSSIKPEEYRNILLFAAEDFPETKLFAELEDQYSLESAMVLTDRHCPLDYLHAKAGKHWRQQYISNFILTRR